MTTYRRHTNLYVTIPSSVTILGGMTKCSYTHDCQFLICDSVKPCQNHRVVRSIRVLNSPRTCSGESRVVLNLSAKDFWMGFCLHGSGHGKEESAVGEDSEHNEEMLSGCLSPSSSEVCLHFLLGQGILSEMSENGPHWQPPAHASMRHVGAHDTCTF